MDHYVLDISGEFQKNQVLLDLINYAFQKNIGNHPMMGIMVFCKNKMIVEELFYFLKKQRLEPLYKVHRTQDARETYCFYLFLCIDRYIQRL